MTTDPNDGVPIFEDEEAARLVGQDFDHVHNEAGRYVYDAMQCGFTAEELDGYETISQGQADDLKHETADGLRYWLSRTGVADGEPFENTITIEIGEGGRWRTIAKYDGGEIPEPECICAEQDTPGHADGCPLQEIEGEDDATLRGAFSLNIDLGNAAMCQVEHVAGAVRTLAERLEAGDQAGNVYDENGNTVGTFKFEAR